MMRGEIFFTSTSKTVFGSDNFVFNRMRLVAQQAHNWRVWLQDRIIG